MKIDLNKQDLTRPLIWTKDGLRYEADLIFSHTWTFLPSKSECREINYEVFYHDRETGELVKHGSAKYLNNPGVEASGVLGQMNGPATITDQGEQSETA